MESQQRRLGTESQNPGSSSLSPSCLGSGGSRTKLQVQEKFLSFIRSFIHSFIVSHFLCGSYSVTGIEYTTVNIINAVPDLTVLILMRETANQAIINHQDACYKREREGHYRKKRDSE